VTLRIGSDVGGTNTDAVLMNGDRVVAKIKTPTTEDVTSGITTALRHVLNISGVGNGAITGVMIGTTHFTNAVVERKRLQPTAIIRIGLPATLSIPPMFDWPDDLRATLGDNAFLCHGGYEFNGREISRFDPGEIRLIADQIGERGIQAVAVSCVFSPVNSHLEHETAEILRQTLPGASVTLSSEIGRIGLLERENAAVLNACLGDLALKTISALRRSISELGITAPIFLTQNDGTLMNAEFAERFPVLTFASGPTNSMRGAAFLSGRKNAVVADIGGTTTDIGSLTHGFPREAAVAIEIGGVRTNFRMPDVSSFGLGGGSLVTVDPLIIGPSSVGYRLNEEALVFGGKTLTATDIAVTAGMAEIGDPILVADLPRALVNEATQRMSDMIAAGIDRMKTSADPVPVILVGGGSILVGDSIEGVSEHIRPDHFEAANAVGAAIAQISGEVDRVFSLSETTRERALEEAKSEAAERAVAAGAALDSVQIVDVEDVPLAYLPGNATRIRVKAVGDLNLTASANT
jgi:N-methylhydantoinase A/oxoprolinase/acetone carboxylase beta subunit